MHDDGVCPYSVTYICIFKCRDIIGFLDIGKDIDAEVRKLGLLQTDLVVGNTLVEMYCKCGALEKAREVFYKLSFQDVVSWNALLVGCVQHELGVHPCAVTYVCTLKFRCITQSLEIGVSLHVDIKRQGLLKTDGKLGNALVDMYFKYGDLRKAAKVF